jgi:predicted 2-oxoglutarate/Fe(II)-dependent dioxygenase YbiX
MPEVIPAFLTSDEIAALRAHAARDGWRPGRQGTGYDILPLRDVPELAALTARGLARIGTPFEDYWDVYLIRYADGSSIPPHTDAAQHGRRHRRINAVLEQARAGGELFVAGALVPLAVGDAVLFSPDDERHEVTQVTGSRLLFSVGAWI